MLFDSHCHLDDPRFPDLEEALAEAAAAGVEGFVVPGVAPEGWQRIANLHGIHRNAYPAFGVHPMHADLLTPEALSELRLRSRTATAIGEIGLDYALPFPSKQLQQTAFRAQLEVAIEAKLPVLIHCRKAFPDLLRILRDEGIGEGGGVMHAFSGSVETARHCLRLGLHISIAGSVTYDNARRPVEVARDLPSDRILLETDAPDLPPVPHRGILNRPAYLAAIARRVADIRGVSLEVLARLTTANAKRLFGID